ncbi:prolyl oligopeptidase family serine peptidase, partial [Marinilabilia sp.]
VGLKFSDIAWKKPGFFYSIFPRGSKFAPTHGQKVLFHKLGTPQSEDLVIFERMNNPFASFDFITSSNERYFVLTEMDEGHGRVNAFYIDFDESKPSFRPLVTNYDRKITFLDSRDNKFIAITSSKTGDNRVVEIDPANPLRWRELVPPFSEGALVETVPFKDKIVALVQANNHPVLLVMDYNGNLLHKAEFPFICSISELKGEPDDDKLQFVLSSYTIPPVVYEFDINTFEKNLVDKTGVAFDFKDIKYKEIEYSSHDGVKVPMVLVYKKPLKRDRPNPVLLSAYGGFGVVHKLSFNPGIVHFIENGGIYAYANIRGGGDKGYEWANAGRGANKQTSFDDFIAAAEYLISKDYTSSDLLAATGTSNGGLVVATTAIQRPDLFKAVIPVVAPTDMLRFEKFTVGPWHRDEYGTVLDSASFCRLKSYSPYHNIKDSVDYPSMLVVTSENDDRVPPLHSYKFVARLQNRAAQRNPILLKVEENAGHFGASSLKLKIRELADQFSFVFHELDMDQ